MAALVDYDYEATDEPRDVEITLLLAMYSLGTELMINPAEPHTVTVTIILDPVEVEEGLPITITSTLAPEYPAVLPSISLHSPLLKKTPLSTLTVNLKRHLEEEREAGNENLVLECLQYVRDELEVAGSPYLTTAAAVSTVVDSVAVLNRTTFTREWCSFVSLYRESYAAGPNRYEVLMSLATERNLAITGMAIAGKPGGLIAEGPGGDVVEFMKLIRTDFFETLNPRGRKCTTRWQEYLPGDVKAEKWEYAQAVSRLRTGNSEDVANTKKAEREKAMKEKNDEKDREAIAAFVKKHGKSLEEEEVDKLILLEGPEEFKGELSKEDIDAYRIFKDFTVFVDKDYEGSYQEAGKIFKEMGRSDGFDAMFAFRFS